MHLTKKVATLSIAALFIISSALMAMPAQAAEYTNPQEGGSIPLPTGVTPDLTYETISYMSFRPNPIGLNQPMLVNLWIQPPIFQARYLTGYKVTFTKPDGTTDVIGPMSTYYGDATAWFEYVVDQVGTWKIKFDFPGGYYPRGNYTSKLTFTLGQTLNAPLGVYYKPSSDGPYEFTVQANPIASWPSSPLPTDYWTRPVSPENREWWPILGYYPSTGVVGGGAYWPADTNRYSSNYAFVPYVQAPNTAHVVWKRQGAMGGLVGGPSGQYSYQSGGGNPSLVFAGRCYQSITKVTKTLVNGTYYDQPTSVWQCYDLRTGEVYWEQTGVPAPTMVSMAVRPVATIDFESARQGGKTIELLYLGGGRLISYDPWVGRINYNISTAPLTTGTFYADPYFLTVQNLGGTKGYRLINWTIQRSYYDYISPSGNADMTYNFPPSVFVANNISWPFSSLGTVDYEAGIAVSTAGVTPSSVGAAYSQQLMGVSLTTGQLLWNVSTDPTTGLEGFFSGSTAVADHGKYAVRLNDGYFHCWDLTTGKKLWKSELSSWPWGIWGPYAISSAYGLIIYPQYDGVVAYNWTNGKIAWWYKHETPYAYETPYQDNMPFRAGVIIADGLIYTYNTEHTPSQPYNRGWKLHCIDATSGKGIWNITGPMAQGAVADGYLTASNTYDGYMYVFGKGKSATTVNAPSTAVAKNTKVLIQGTILDISPAQPNTPCVSKDSMSTQMEYLHMQHPVDGLDHNIQMTGVPVTLTALDSSGNATPIGTTTTNAYYGTFSYEWTTPNEDKYTIIASFAGDDSYSSSAASTTLSVGAALTSIDNGQQVTVPDYTMTIVYGVIAIIIAVIISVATATILILRKK
ncbi:MAG TPA: PQQ-binding-like beta-propeller repeat protein [Candidatus Sulfotelmatobacter sp.]|nr:PQQ-binding-like beta-propeller repeat protein [Candidatus Sulfotelmatobacter sp.]